MTPTQTTTHQQQQQRQQQIKHHIIIISSNSNSNPNPNTTTTTTITSTSDNTPPTLECPTAKLASKQTQAPWCCDGGVLTHFAFSGSRPGVTRSSLGTLSIYFPMTSCSKLFWMFSAVTSAVGGTMSFASPCRPCTNHAKGKRDKRHSNRSSSSSSDSSSRSSITSSSSHRQPTAASQQQPAAAKRESAKTKKA